MTPLSAREMEVARLIADGLSDKEIAAILIIRVATVKTHLERIALKLGANKARSRRVAITVFIERCEHPKTSTESAA